MASKTFTTGCSFCFKQFKSLYTLRKHLILKHPDTDWESITAQFKKIIGKDLSENAGHFHHYKLWLAGLVERINSTFHPRLPCKYNCFYILVSKLRN